MLLKHKYSVFVNILYMQFWAYNFKNIEVRIDEMFTIKISITF